jgi:hypothetical protein
MCTIENTEKLCKGTLEACSVVMGPSVRSCGRGAWVSTRRGAHKKNARAACPWRWGQGQRPAPGTAIVAGPGFILGSHNHARRPCPSQSSSSTVRQTPSVDGGHGGATAGMGGNPACDSPGAVEIATRWAEYSSHRVCSLFFIFRLSSRWKQPLLLAGRRPPARARRWRGALRADPRRGHQREQGGRGWADGV